MNPTATTRRPPPGEPATHAQPHRRSAAERPFEPARAPRHRASNDVHWEDTQIAVLFLDGPLEGAGR